MTRVGSQRHRKKNKIGNFWIVPLLQSGSEMMVGRHQLINFTDDDRCGLVDMAGQKVYRTA